MQYFKHYHNADSSTFIQKVIKVHGLLGYAWWNLLLELMCEKFNGDSVLIQLTVPEIAKKLRIKSARVHSIISSFSELGHNEVITKLESNDNQANFDGFIIIISAHILLDLKDRDFKRARINRAENAPKNKIKNKEKDKDKKEIKKGDESPDPIPDIVDSDIILKATAQSVFELWNSGCGNHGLPKVMTLNDARKKKINIALKDIPMLEDWKKVFEVTAGKGFVAKDGKPFIPNFDYVFRNHNYISFLESYESEQAISPCGTIADPEAVINSYLQTQGVIL